MSITRTTTTTSEHPEFIPDDLTPITDLLAQCWEAVRRPTDETQEACVALLTASSHMPRSWFNRQWAWALADVRQREWIAPRLVPLADCGELCADSSGGRGSLRQYLDPIGGLTSADRLERGMEALTERRERRERTREQLVERAFPTVVRASWLVSEMPILPEYSARSTERSDHVRSVSRIACCETENCVSVWGI